MLMTDRQICMQKLCNKRYSTSTCNKENLRTLKHRTIINIASELNPILYLYPKKELLEILQITGNVISQMLLDGESFQLPNSTGLLEILTYNQKTGDRSQGEVNNLITDPVATKKLWDEKPEFKNIKFVYYVNADLTYNRLKFRKFMHITPMLRYYKFKTCATLKKKIATVSMKGTRYKTKVNI